MTSRSRGRLPVPATRVLRAIDAADGEIDVVRLLAYVGSPTLLVTSLLALEGRFLVRFSPDGLKLYSSARGHALLGMAAYRDWGLLGRG